MIKSKERTLLKKHILKILNNKLYKGISSGHSNNQVYQNFSYKNKDYDINVYIELNLMLTKIWHIKMKVDGFTVLNNFKIFCNKVETDIIYTFIERKVKPKFEIHKYIPVTELRKEKINKLKKKNLIIDK